MRNLALAAFGLLFVASAAPALAASDCPAGGTIRFGVEPYDSNAILTPIYAKIGQDITKATGCPVEVDIATSYNAEIEAMRAGKLEIASSARSAMCWPTRWRTPRRSPRWRMPTASRLSIPRPS